MNSKLTATFTVSFEKFSGPPKEFTWDMHSLQAASVTCLAYFIILSEPLILKHQTGWWLVHWKWRKKKEAMAYAELSFWHMNGVTQENYNKFQSS